jgi:hypothetical protein
MDRERTVKRITEWRPTTERRIGRPWLKWEDDVTADLEISKMQNWSKMAMDREVRKRITGKTKPHKLVAPREEE